MKKHIYNFTVETETNAAGQPIIAIAQSNNENFDEVLLAEEQVDTLIKLIQEARDELRAGG